MDDGRHPPSSFDLFFASITSRPRQTWGLCSLSPSLFLSLSP
jgi:hypothetical protein